MKVYFLCVSLYGKALLCCKYKPHHETESDEVFLIFYRYEATIVGQFFGHTHDDEFELFYDLNNASRAIK